MEPSTGFATRDPRVRKAIANALSLAQPSTSEQAELLRFRYDTRAVILPLDAGDAGIGNFGNVIITGDDQRAAPDISYMKRATSAFFALLHQREEPGQFITRLWPHAYVGPGELSDRMKLEQYKFSRIVFADVFGDDDIWMCVIEFTPTVPANAVAVVLHTGDDWYHIIEAVMTRWVKINEMILQPTTTIIPIENKTSLMRGNPHDVIACKTIFDLLAAIMETTSTSDFGMFKEGFITIKQLLAKSKLKNPVQWLNGMFGSRNIPYLGIDAGQQDRLYRGTFLTEEEAAIHMQTSDDSRTFRQPLPVKPRRPKRVKTFDRQHQRTPSGVEAQEAGDVFDYAKQLVDMCLTVMENNVHTTFPLIEPSFASLARRTVNEFRESHKNKPFTKLPADRILGMLLPLYQATEPMMREAPGTEDKNLTLDEKNLRASTLGLRMLYMENLALGNYAVMGTDSNAARVFGIENYMDPAPWTFETFWIREDVTTVETEKGMKKQRFGSLSIKHPKLIVRRHHSIAAPFILIKFAMEHGILSIDNTELHPWAATHLLSKILDVAQVTHPDDGSIIAWDWAGKPPAWLSEIANPVAVTGDDGVEYGKFWFSETLLMDNPLNTADQDVIRTFYTSAKVYFENWQSVAQFATVNYFLDKDGPGIFYKWNKIHALLKIIVKNLSLAVVDQSFLKAVSNIRTITRIFLLFDLMDTHAKVWIVAKAAFREHKMKWELKNKVEEAFAIAFFTDKLGKKKRLLHRGFEFEPLYKGQPLWIDIPEAMRATTKTEAKALQSATQWVKNRMAKITVPETLGNTLIQLKKSVGDFWTSPGEVSAEKYDVEVLLSKLRLRLDALLNTVKRIIIEGNSDIIEQYLDDLAYEETTDGAMEPLSPLVGCLAEYLGEHPLS